MEYIEKIKNYRRTIVKTREVQSFLFAGAIVHSKTLRYFIEENTYSEKISKLSS